MSAVVSQTDFAGLKLRARGKVRDIYELGDRLLIVATDRLSAFDVILPTPIPDKGRVLTQLSLFWFDKLAKIVPNHVISASNFSGELAPYAAALEGRAMLVRRTEPVPIECVVRGYLSGSGWKDYQKTGSVCGIALPRGSARERPVAGADFHAVHEGDHRPRREYFLRRNSRANRRARSRKSCAIPASRSTRARLRMRRNAASSSPTRNSSSD